MACLTESLPCEDLRPAARAVVHSTQRTNVCVSGLPGRVPSRYQLARVTRLTRTRSLVEPTSKQPPPSDVTYYSGTRGVRAARVKRFFFHNPPSHCISTR